MAKITGGLYKLDDKDRAVVRALIKDPTLSDNAISKLIRIPVKTVNRRRKGLEENGVISYHLNVDMSATGTGRFNARHLYLIRFKLGFPQARLVKEIMEEPNVRTVFTDYIYESHIAEMAGHTALVMVIEGANDDEVNEAFNSKVIPSLKKNHGEGAVLDVMTIRLSKPIRIFHNYLFMVNMVKGKISDDWPQESIFVE